MEAAVRSGVLPPGAGIPSVRALALDLAVSPGTVGSAYRLLRQRGVVQAAGRHGTRVRARPVIGARAAQRLPVLEGMVDLASGSPDPRLLPPLGPGLARLDGAPIPYQGGGPVPELLEAARQRLAADGAPTGAMTVTHGALDAIERALVGRLAPGDRVAVEDPGWANLLDLIAALGLEPVPAPVDESGPIPDQLAAAVASGARAVILTSRAQNPTGAVITPQRAAELRQVLARRAELLVIEDDHAAELSAAPLAPVCGGGQSWAFVRSTSKPYGPDLRLAVLVGDEATVSRVEGRMRMGAGWVSTLQQRLVLELWRDDAVAAAVRRARAAYQARREGLIAALTQRGVAAIGREGINVWASAADETAAVARLRDRGWAVAPGSMCRLASPPGLRITVASLPESAIEPLAADVADAVRPGRVGFGA